MNDVEARLRRLAAPREDEAGERAWLLVRAAFDEREPVAGRRRALRPALAFAAVTVALVAAAVTPPGRAVLDGVREAIGVERAAPELFSLPAPGRLLVESDAGAWIVRRDGSKRLLPGYREASWSPFGAYVVATRRNALAALEPEGRVRWTLPRRDVRGARWGGTRTDTRIAYLSGETLRVVAGDGTGDHAVTRGPHLGGAPLAWRPGRPFELAYVARGMLRLIDDRGRERWTARVGDARSLEWSRDGRRLLVRARRRLVVLDDRGRTRIELLAAAHGAAPVAAAALAPSGRSVAFVQQAAGRSVLWVVPRLAPDASVARRVFTGAGRFTDVAWSPDGRWLLVAWPDADQWVFIRSTRVRRIEAFSAISRQFESERFPELAGWCCP